MTRNYSLGGISSFGVEHGFLEGVIRGLSSGFVSHQEYVALAQCTTFEDFKLSLGDTDYCQVLQNVSKLNEDIIYKKCYEKFVGEFNFIRGQATGAVATFMDFLTYEPMINNISFIISSLIKKSHSNEEYDGKTILGKCDPIGGDPHLKLLFWDSQDGKDEDNLARLYRTVLIETPVARYFTSYFNEELRPMGNEEKSEGIGKVYEEKEFEIITERLQALRLEDFYQYTQRLGGETAEIMAQLLGWEADKRALNVTQTSFASEDLNSDVARETVRQHLYCNFGTFHPEGTAAPKNIPSSFYHVTNQETLSSHLQTYYTRYYNAFCDADQHAEGKDFHTLMDEYEVKVLRQAFSSQSHLCCFYGWYKLKLVELRNIKWILSCITQRVTDANRKNKWIPITGGSRSI